MLPFESVKGAGAGHHQTAPVITAMKLSGSTSAVAPNGNDGAPASQSLSLGTRPHSRPVGTTNGPVGAQRPMTKAVFGLRGMATESPMKFPQQPAMTRPGPTATSSPTRRPPTVGDESAIAASPLRNRASSPTKASTTTLVVGKCYVNPNTKMTPSVQQQLSATHTTARAATSSTTAMSNESAAAVSGTPLASKFAARRLAPALSATELVAGSAAATSAVTTSHIALESLQLVDGADGASLTLLSSTAASPIAGAPSQHQHPHPRYSFDGPGLTVAELAPPTSIQVDLRTYDINDPIPRNNMHTCTVPKFKFTTIPPPTVRCRGEALSGGASQPFVVEDFVKYVVDVSEATMDRALEYHTFADVRDLFEVQPTINAETGSLSFVPAAGVTGATKVYVRLADNASVDPATGAIMTSAPQAFEVEIVRGGAAATATAASTIGNASTVHNGTSVATLGATMTSRTISPTKSGKSFPTSTSSPTKPSALLAGSAATIASKANGPPKIVRVSPDIADGEPEQHPGHFDFPTGTPHALRYDVVVQSHQQQFASATQQLAQSQQQQQQVQGGASAATNGAPAVRREVQAAFSSVVCDIEKLKIVHATQERDRLAGDPVDNETAFEADLLDKLHREESVCGPMGVELCPLLMRLAQVRIGAGAKRHGDAIETLERICRIRMRVVGLDGFADISAAGAIARQSADEAATLTASMIGGGQSFANSLLISPLKISMMSSSPGALAAAAAAAAASSGAGGSPSNAASAIVHRNFEALLQSLTVLATFFKLLGRFQEAIEFFEHAQGVAAAHFGFDSVQFARALSQLAEMHYYEGSYDAAIRLFEKAIASAEVLLGPDAASTAALVHLYGVCLIASGETEKGIAQHERALATRRKLALEDTDGGAEFAVAESLTFYAAALNRHGADVRAAKMVDEALDVLRQFDTSKSVEYTLSRCTILSIAARVKIAASAKDPKLAAAANAEALAILEECVADAGRVRGMDSVEGAIFLAELAATRLRTDALEKCVVELKYAHSIFASSLGTRHHYTARTQVLLAQVLMSSDIAVAKELAENASAALKSALRPFHRDLGVAYEILARICLGMREDHRALQLAKMSYAITLRSKHESHLPALETLMCGAHTRCGMALPAEVFKRIEERANQARVEYGETSQFIVAPMQNLAEAYFLLGQYDRAHHALSKALKVADSMNFIYLLGHLFKPASQLSVTDLHERNRIASDRIDAQQAHQFAVILHAIGAVFEAEGLLEDAQSTYLQSHAALEIAGVPTGLGVVECLTALGRILNRQGCYGDALAYFERAYNVLLEFHPKQLVAIQGALAKIHTMQCILRANGYTLVRHVDGRHRFATYI